VEEDGHKIKHMKNYGSKDIMRMESIRDKAHGDYMQQLLYAYNMSCAITEPGKALARGFAAKEVFGEHTAVAQVFFERATDLTGGIEVRPVASVNPWDDSEEGIEAEYENIPIKQQPASRRPDFKVLEGTVNRKTPWSLIIPLGKLNTIKGEGPQFSLYKYPKGTIEVWQNEDGRYRLLYTSNYESVYYVNEKRKFKYDGKIVEWTLVDYIESEHIANLAPMYGKSISIYNYD